MSYNIDILLNLCKQGNNQCLRDIIESGFDGDTCNSQEITLLHVASAFGQEQIVDLLLSKHIKVDSPTNLGWTPLMQAARNGYSSIVTKLLDNGADICQKNRYGLTVLTLAVASNDLLTIATVVNATCSKTHTHPQNSQSTSGSALSVAVLFGNPNVMRALFDFNFNSNIFSPNGVTALMVAASVGNCAMVYFLLNHKANPFIINYLGHTALDVATMKGYVEIITLLNYHQKIQTAIFSEAALPKSPCHQPVLQNSSISKTNRYLYSDVVPKSSTAKSQLKLQHEQYQYPVCSPTVYDSLPCSHGQANVNARCNLKSTPPRISGGDPSTILVITPCTLATPCKGIYTNSQRDTHLSPFASIPFSSDKENVWKNTETRKYGNNIDYKYSRSNSSPKSTHPKPIAFSNSDGVLYNTSPNCTPNSLKGHWSRFRKKLSSLNSPKYSFSPQPGTHTRPNKSNTNTALEETLQRLNLSSYAPLFLKQELDVNTVFLLKEEDLEEMGIQSASVRRDILTKIGSHCKGNKLRFKNNCF